MNNLQETTIETTIETNSVEIKLDEFSGSPSQINEYTIQDELGEGAYGKVYLCENHENIQFAIKMVNKSLLRRKREFKRLNGCTVTSDAFQKVQREIAIMKKLSHPNLTKMVEVIDSVEDGKLFLVLEYVAGGQLMEWDPLEKLYICPITNSSLPLDTARHCLYDIVPAIQYLHINNICHRDVKPENILIGSNGSFKLSDFGVAHMFEETEGSDLKLNNTEGTYHFIAPECMLGERYDPFKVDIWALGVTFYAMLYGTIPFGRNYNTSNMPALVDAIRTEALIFPPEDKDLLSQDLVSRMLEREPEKRITLREILAHPWLAENSQYPEYIMPALVEVSNEEIDLAFTPTNNFILMSKLKMRLSSKLASMRSSRSCNSSGSYRQSYNEDLDSSKACQNRFPSPCMSPMNMQMPTVQEQKAISKDLIMVSQALVASQERRDIRRFFNFRRWNFNRNQGTEKEGDDGCNLM